MCLTNLTDITQYLKIEPNNIVGISTTICGVISPTNEKEKNILFIGQRLHFKINIDYNQSNNSIINILKNSYTKKVFIKNNEKIIVSLKNSDINLKFISDDSGFQNLYLEFDWDFYLDNFNFSIIINADNKDLINLKFSKNNPFLKIKSPFEISFVKSIGKEQKKDSDELFEDIPIVILKISNDLQGKYKVFFFKNVAQSLNFVIQIDFYGYIINNKIDFGLFDQVNERTILYNIFDDDKNQFWHKSLKRKIEINLNFLLFPKYKTRIKKAYRGITIKLITYNDKAIDSRTKAVIWSKDSFNKERVKTLLAYNTQHKFISTLKYLTLGFSFGIIIYPIIDRTFSQYLNMVKTISYIIIFIVYLLITFIEYVIERRTDKKIKESVLRNFDYIKSKRMSLFGYHS